MNEQTDLGLADDGTTKRVEEYRMKPPRRPIRGYPELWWAGKRPFDRTRYYPAQLKETHGEAVDGARADGAPVKGWRNKLFWGDNLQVMSHLLKEFRGQVDLVYIDPPFDSKADYKKTVKLKGKSVENDHSAFEEKQYSDIWTNDEYLQFMYERLVLLRELLSDTGSIWLHCDWRKSHHLRQILDEVFGPDRFQASISWRTMTSSGYKGKTSIGRSHADLLVYAKGTDPVYNPVYTEMSEDMRVRYRHQDPDGRLFKDSYLGDVTEASLKELEAENLVYWTSSGTPRIKHYLDEAKGLITDDVWVDISPEDSPSDDIPSAATPSPQEALEAIVRGYVTHARGLLANEDMLRADDLWTDINPTNSQSALQTGYPTQKPEPLLERVIRMSTNPGALVFDAFMGSGTTQAVALKTGRRYLGADINLGSIQTATKRLLQIDGRIIRGQSALDLDGDDDQPETRYTGFEVYNVNHYDVFRNPAQAKDLLLEALEVQPLAQSALYDGEKDGRMVKVMPVNRLATKQDLNELLTGFDLKTFDKRKQAQPNRAVEKVTLVCMGHDPELRPTLVREVKQLGYAIDVEVVDILRDRADLQFKREAEAEVVVKDGHLEIGAFYPMNLLQKLSLLRENVEDWREMVESVMIDWNYDGAVLTPQVVDVPEGDALVSGRYKVPEDAGTIRLKITDLLSESLELDVDA